MDGLVGPWAVSAGHKLIGPESPVSSGPSLALLILRLKLVVTERLFGMNVKEPWRSLDFCKMKMIFICPGASL